MTAQALAEASRAPFSEAWSRLDEQIRHPLVSALEEAARAHREAIEAAGLEGAPPGGPEDALTAIRDYVRGVGKVHEAVLTAFEHHDATSALDDALERAFRDAQEACAALPDTATLPWDDALAPRPADGGGRRLAKGLARWVSAARRPAATRPAPIRRVAERHLWTRVAPAHSDAGRVALLEWGRWMAAHELAWASWSSRVLAALAAESLAVAETGVEEATTVQQGAEEATASELWPVAVEEARALQAHLGAQALLDPYERASAQADARVAEAETELREDLALAGSVLRRFGGETRPDGPSPWDASARRTEAWKGWREGAIERMRLHQALLDLIQGTGALQRRLLERVSEEAYAFLGDAPTDGSAAFRTLKGALDADGTGDLEALATRLERGRADADALVGRFLARDSVNEAVASVNAATGAAAEGLQALLRQVPERFVLHPVAPRPAELSKPNLDEEPVPLREIAHQAFDALRIERVRTSAETLDDALRAAAEQLTELRGVVSFGFDAAQKEIDGDEGEPETDEAGAGERGLGLAVGGLRRTAEALAAIPDSLDAACRRMDLTLAAEIARGCRIVVDRALARGMQGQLLGVRSKVSASVREAVGRLAPGMSRATRSVRLVWARLRREGERLVRRARRALGTAEPSATSTFRSLRALARATEELKGIPLVYQRLFTFEPLTDGSLLAGREVQIAEFEARASRSLSGDAFPLVVTGHPGVGVTSFLNVVSERLAAAGMSLAQGTLETRFDTEARLSEWLAELLGIPSGPEPMDALTARILDTAPGELPAVAVLHGLEHAYLRTPGGTDLVERFMTLMAETGRRIFWITSSTRSAWQLMRMSEPTAVSQLEVMELADLPPTALREAVLLRHRRSGVPIEYEEPSEGRLLLRRRLRGLRGTEAHRRVLEEDYFERLRESAKGNMGLALYYWLRSADFGAGRGSLRVRPLAPIDLSALEALDLAQNFTLKALLEHRTLTLAEHDVIFRIPHQESFQLFESLRNRHLIEPLPGQSAEAASVDIHETVRYRIVPLLAGAVWTHLGTRNIVH